MNDRRRSRRVSVTADITYQVDGVATTKRIADISEGGVFIDSPVPADVGTRVALKFALEGEAIEAIGQVAYSQPYVGMGVEFVEVSDQSKAAIRRYVEHVSEPALAR